MLLPRVLVMGEPSLVELSKEITLFNDDLLKLISDMTRIMHDKSGAGISAPQIGINKRIIVYGFENNERYPDAKPVPRTILINPEYEPLNDEVEPGMEGCLSLPGLRGLVSRYKNIKYSGYDQSGNPVICGMKVLWEL